MDCVDFADCIKTRELRLETVEVGGLNWVAARNVLCLPNGRCSSSKTVSTVLNNYKYVKQQQISAMLNLRKYIFAEFTCATL